MAREHAPYCATWWGEHTRCTCAGPERWRRLPFGWRPWGWIARAVEELRRDLNGNGRRGRERR